LLKRTGWRQAVQLLLLLPQADMLLLLLLLFLLLLQAGLLLHYLCQHCHHHVQVIGLVLHRNTAAQRGAVCWPFCSCKIKTPLILDHSPNHQI
jgi:hypothetical protein